MFIPYIPPTDKQGPTNDRARPLKFSSWIAADIKCHRRWCELQLSALPT